MAEALVHEADHDHPHPNYMAVFWWLFGITVAEVAVAYVHLSPALMITILMGMAFAKAVLVALYFMHLKYDNKLLMVIAVVPVILAAIAVTIVSVEYATYTMPESARTTYPPLNEDHE